MVINWYGEACFRIQTGDTVVLTDPFPASTGGRSSSGGKGGSASGGDIGVGLTPPRGKVDVILRTRTELPIPYTPEREDFHVEGPGEYEVKGIEIVGFPCLPVGRDTPKNGGETFDTIYRVKAEGLRIALFGHIAEVPDAEVLERLGEVDVLFIPAGGAPFLSVEKAVKLVRQVNPKIVVATLFKIPKLERKAGDVKAFLEEIEQKGVPQEKLVIKKKDLPTTLQVVVLTV